MKKLLLLLILVLAGFGCRKVSDEDDPVVLVSIAVTNMPTQTSYYVNDNFDPLGMVITGSYSNGSRATIPTEDTTLSGYDSSTAGTKTITVTYGGKSTNLAVTVADPAIVAIELTTEPTKIAYSVGDSLDLSGMELTAVAINGSRNIIDNSDVTTDFDSSELGSKKLTVSYLEFEAKKKVMLTFSDLTGPIVGNSGTIESSDIASDKFTLTWTVSTDNVSASSDLGYKVVYSKSDNIDSVDNAEANGTTAQDWMNNILTYEISGLNPSTVYYFNVLVKDEVGNKSVYTTNSVTTLRNWTNFGSAGFTESKVRYTDLELDSSNNVYASFQDRGNFENATVMTYNGSNWELVGDAGFSESKVEYLDLEIDGNDTLYVAYRHISSNNKATVMTYNGNSWEYVGSPGFSIKDVAFIKLRFDSTNTPYVVYSDGGNSDRITVMKYNGSSWVNVGDAGFSSSEVYYTDIEFDSSDVPYVVYKDKDSLDITVMKYDGTNWVGVGESSISDYMVNYTDLELDSNDTPYIVYGDASNINHGKATVKKYNGSSWEIVGDPAFSSATVADIDLELNSNDELFVSYRYNSNPRKATVKKFDGIEWKTIGTVGFTPGAVKYTDLEFDSDDNPYIIYQDDSNSDKATVMKY